MNIPVGDKVLIKPDEVGERTVAGIILAQKDKRFVDTGTIVALSKDYDFEGETGVPLKEGDHVRYSPNTQEYLDDGLIGISAQHIWYIIN